MLLYINKQLVDLDSSQTIAQTKQVNDLNSIDNRQASYTNKFKLPKTANNIRIMGYLTLAGNTSEIPYQKNECSLFGDNGECFVYNGWAVISDGGDSYDAVIYDGIIDLYKKVEGKTLASLYLDNYKHDKTISVVKESWNRTAPYIYLAADYNGDTGNTAARKVNIDYLIPAMSVEYLWWQIGYGFGINYKGSIFGNPEFKNLYLTFPKGAETVASSQLLFENSNYGFESSLTAQEIGFNENPKPNKYFARLKSFPVNQSGVSSSNGIQLRVAQAGNYLLEVSGSLNTRTLQYMQTEGLQTAANIYVARNATGTKALNATRYGEYLAVNVPHKTTFSSTRTLNLSAGDTVSVVIAPSTAIANNTFIMPELNQALTVKLTKVELTEISFNEAFSEFSIKDFIKETLHHFGLTMYKDKFSDTYHFLTLKEVLEDSQTADWSRQFVKKISENYISGSYARQNWFRYKYNDKESAYNDGYLEVANENLEESKTVLSSILYSPEKAQTTLLGKPSYVFKFWEKELTEATEDEPASISYKPLDKRYFFVKGIEETLTLPVWLYSDAYPEDEAIVTAGSPMYRAGFDGMSFTTILEKYYSPFRMVLNRSRMVTAEVWLTESEVANFDFKKRYYIEQLGSYFLVNKINNYIPGKPAKCELIRIESNPENPFAIKITKVVIQVSLVRVFFETTTPINAYILEYNPGNDAWTSLPFTGSSPAVFNLTEGTYNLQLRANGQLSNSVTITVPDIKVINIA